MKLVTNLDSFKRRISWKKKKKGKDSSSSSFGSTTSSLSSPATSPRSILPSASASASGTKNKEVLAVGAVTREELEAALRSIMASEAELAETLMLLADDAEAGAVLEEVATAAADEGELRETFAVFDADGDGRISAEELREVLASLGGDEPCSVEDCRRMIRGVDTDGDGFVCFDEFTRMMMH